MVTSEDVCCIAYDTSNVQSFNRHAFSCDVISWQEREGDPGDEIVFATVFVTTAPAPVVTIAVL